MERKDLYQVLGLQKGANEDEIRAAYRRLAREHHPDVNPGDAASEERFKEISAAKEVLLSEEKRRLYDEFGFEGLHAGFDPSEARAYREWNRRARKSPGFEDARGMDANSIDVEDLLSQLFGGGFPPSDANADFGGRGFGSAAPNRASNRLDLETGIDVDFVDAVEGNEVSMRVEGGDPIRVRIPKGAADGTRIRLKGQGRKTSSNQAAGDLYVRLRVRPHPVFRREGDDLHVDLPVTVPELVLGAEVAVPTSDGEVQVKIPARSKNGSVLRLQGKGVARKGVSPSAADSRGHLFLHLRAVLPTDADPALESLIRQLEPFYADEDPRSGVVWEARR